MGGGETIGLNSPSKFVIRSTHGSLGLADGLVTGMINQDSREHILSMAEQ